MAESNALLAAGGYGLWVERDADGGMRLAGVGSGLPLGAEPAWADLYRALVRLRRTRRSFDAAWLQRLVGSLGADLGEPPDACYRVPTDRIELLPGRDRELAEKSLSALSATGRGLPFPVERTTVGRRSGAVRLQTVDSRDSAVRRLDRAELLAGIVASDSDLRMHCATQSVPGAVLDTATGAAAVLRTVEPAPAHPTHPGGTIGAGLSTLLRPANGVPGLLSVVLDNRFEQREDELEHFLEHFVRPLLRVFRLALDTHDLGLFALDEGGFAFELSPELQATGRIVITDHDRITREPTRTEVTAGVRALVSTLDKLGDGYAELRPEKPGARVRDEVRRVITEELRYLAPHTAELLSGEQPLQGYAHSVPAGQDAVLKSVLEKVQLATRARRSHPRAPQPAVVIDVDLCGLVPLQRIMDSARASSGPRPGAPDGILELAGPGTLPVLPTHVPGAWAEFVRRSGLGERYPGVDFDQLRGDFLRAFQSRPWDRLPTDQVNAGLGRFVWDVRDAGGRVVFCTARRERFREVTEQALAEAGIADVTTLFAPEDASRPIAEVKAAQLRRLGLDVVAVFDDESANRAAVTAEFDGARAVAVEISGVAADRPCDVPPADDAPVIATFETRPRSEEFGSRLSNTHSLEELQIGAMRRNPLARRWGVHLGHHVALNRLGTVR